MMQPQMTSAASTAPGPLPWRGRSRHYAELHQRLQAALAAPRSEIAVPEPQRGDFDPVRLLVTPDFLKPEWFGKLKGAAETLAKTERSYVPTHKQGGTIAYDTIVREAPVIAAYYHSDELKAYVSRIAGLTLIPTPLRDQSSLSLLVYERPGDHIGWHYDHNFYRGRHFTILLPLENRGTGPGGLSHATLYARMEGEERMIASPPNTLIMFEGAAVHHRVTPIIAGERRVVRSMTYCADPRAAWWQEVGRRAKDTAFFGLRALWT